MAGRIFESEKISAGGVRSAVTLQGVDEIAYNIHTKLFIIESRMEKCIDIRGKAVATIRI
jgi:hypothetical protein